MLEKHHQPSHSVWDVNSIWLAFLFLCICWVVIMVLIIHRDRLNYNRINELINQRSEVIIQLDRAEPQSPEREELEDRLESINSRIATAVQPPTAMFMLYSAFGGLFILGYYLLLWRLGPQIRSMAMRIYLATLPLGFIYIFLLVTLWQPHSPSQLFSNTLAACVALYFAGGLVASCAHAILWGEKPPPDQSGNNHSAGSS
ncbi:hypothetical protein JXA47_06330 [Candidatus Sumerlaeota bacterium]|nr:hypothetical protein [Candidatus Sumerlaeota bacterium]